MNIVRPIEAPPGAASPRPVALSLGTEREIWEERRRLMERRGGGVGPDGRRPAWRDAVVSAGVAAFAAAAKLCGLAAPGRRNALAPRLVERSFAFPELPRAFEGYRILQVSDTHLDCLPELAMVARAMLETVEIDLVVLTGDIHGRHRAPLRESVAPLAAMLEGLDPRDGHVAVLGNHDPAAMAEALEDLGFAVLINRSMTLARGGERIVVTGLDDVHRFFTPAAHAALGSAPPGFRIALVHSAEMADHAETENYALYLCGHTHGGQLCLPGGRPILTHLRRCRFGARGEWRWGRMVGYTSSGLGVSGAPLRYNCPGEMAIITLHRERAKG
ncbi:MAG TPA: metallophosphoesterase [Stellaceae bacterium]|nr:metallophosphoesterase [Stellaceae bacterium]